MIKANELRIGNFVQTSIHSALKDFDFFKVTGKFIAQVEEMKNGEAVCYDPIPLSHEILEACGFIPDDEYNETFKGVAKGVFLKLTIPRPDGKPIPNDFRLTACWKIGEENNAWCDYTVNDKWASTHIKHLHRLQNLVFALTGSELQVNLTQKATLKTATKE